MTNRAKAVILVKRDCMHGWGFSGNFLWPICIETRLSFFLGGGGGGGEFSLVGIFRVELRYI